jgi:nucleotidyltransferase/DNA polymerase involved in DNA repair
MASTAFRCIVHLDLDCFYAQTERLRLRLPPETPLVVVQWGSVLAVSYPARAFGIKRGDKIPDVLFKSPHPGAVVIVAVETIGESNPDCKAILDDVANPVPAHRQRYSPYHGKEEPGIDVKCREKVSLSRYRDASSRIFAVIGSMVPNFERASIDEVRNYVGCA